jgi:hypothetical protein
MQDQNNQEDVSDEFIFFKKGDKYKDQEGNIITLTSNGYFNSKYRFCVCDTDRGILGYAFLFEKCTLVERIRTKSKKK